MFKTFFPVLSVMARILIAFSVTFLVPGIWAWFEDHHDLQWIWLAGFGLTAVSGLVLAAITQQHRRELKTKDGFLLVNMVWLVLPAYSALPLMFLVPDISWFKAYFEAMSALTATGATALSGLEHLPVSVNIWRCFLQLIGGLGIMLLVVAVLPMLGLGGVQLYKAETPGPMKDTKFTPRISETARGLWGVYFVFSGACLLAYRWAGMSWADAFMHMCTTMGLGGFSSYDASFAHFNSPLIEGVAIVFMTLAGISFVRYFVVLRTLSLKPVTNDHEIRTYFAVLLLATLLLTVLLLANGVYSDWAHALRVSAFHVVSLATTTGYAATDYALWPVFAPVLLMFLGCFVSCAGSTGGGIKMIRAQLLYIQVYREFVKLLHPTAAVPAKLGGQVMENKVIFSVLAFLFIYIASIVAMTLVMMASGLDDLTSFSAIVASINNTGPGLHKVGPATTYAVLSDFQTWVCTFAMLLGRLELFTVLIVFTPVFWRK